MNKKTKILYAVAVVAVAAVVGVTAFFLGRASVAGRADTVPLAEESGSSTELQTGTLDLAQENDVTTGSSEAVQTHETTTDTESVTDTQENSGSEGRTESDETEETASESTTGQENTNSSEDGSTASDNGEKGTPYEVHGKLSVVGTQLTDEHGEAFQLRGVSTHGLQWFPQFVNYDTFAELYGWGANTVRLAMYSAEGGYSEKDDKGKEQLDNLIDTGVQAATELGMYVIIDWHILSDGNPKTNEEKALDFFDRMSEKYKDYGNVIYEICNEPNGNVSWSDVKSYADNVIPVIRNNAPDAIIIVGTTFWCQDVDIAAASPIEGYDNLLYALHFYADTHREGLRNKLDGAIDKGLPIIVSEFGVCDASGSGNNNFNEGNTWINTLDSYGISYCIWSLSNKAETASLIASGCNKLSGFEDSELSEAGQWYKGILMERMDSSTDTGEKIPRQDRETEQNETTSTQAEKETVKTDANNFTVSAECTNSWASDNVSFGQYSVMLENKGTECIDGWTVEITFASEVELSQFWCCSANADGRTVVITPAEYNTTINAGESRTDIGLILSGTDLTIESITIK